MRAVITVTLLLLAPQLRAVDGPDVDVSAAETPAAAARCGAHRVILGARTQDRPIPLMSGDAASGFRPACSVRWAVLSPDNRPLTVAACYRDSLLQIDDESVCGAGTGRLWVPSRWVVTDDAGAIPTQSPAPTCQRLETGTYAASRDLNPTCVPKR